MHHIIHKCNAYDFQASLTDDKPTLIHTILGAYWAKGQAVIAKKISSDGVTINNFLHIAQEVDMLCFYTYMRHQITMT